MAQKRHKQKGKRGYVARDEEHHQRQSGETARRRRRRRRRVGALYGDHHRFAGGTSRG